MRDTNTKITNLTTTSSSSKTKIIRFNTSEKEALEAESHSIIIDAENSIINIISNFGLGFKLRQSLFFDNINKDVLKIKTKGDTEKIINLVRKEALLIDAIYPVPVDPRCGDEFHSFGFIINMMSSQDRTYLIMRKDDKEDDRAYFNIFCLDSDALKELTHPDPEKDCSPILSIIHPDLSKLENFTDLEILPTLIQELLSFLKEQNNQNNYFDSLLNSDDSKYDCMYLGAIDC